MYKNKKEAFEEQIVWVYKENSNGDFWFIDVAWKDKWYYVYSFNKKDALDWDEVLAWVKFFKWRQEAVVLKVQKRSTNNFVWELVLSKSWSFWFVVIKNPSIKKDIFVAWKYIWNMKTWDIVSVQILKWEWKNPEWKIIDLVWKKWEKDIDLKSYILETWFKKDFPEKIIKNLKTIKKEFNKNEYKTRKDLRKLFTFTIDWEDAKDLDDAISILEKENWDYRLFVHIADVSSYIKEWSSLDREAIKRWTSVYIPGDVLPMLPELLSNNLCSLNPNEEKLTLTCEMIIWKDWELKKQLVYESIIKSDYRLTYKEVDDIVSSKVEIWKVLTFKKKLDENLMKTIKKADELKVILFKNKYAKGVLNFDFDEIKVDLDKEKEEITIWKYKRYNSNKLIEEFMVLANEAVSRKFTTYPFLYRVHEEPKIEDIEKLQKTLDLYDIKFRFTKYTTKEFSDLLGIISLRDDIDWKAFLENTILRTLTKAVYSDKNLWHFWLWIKFYSHFTSPIRRYPDLQIHRIIKEKLSWKLNQTRIIHYKNILAEIWKQSSDQERKAEKLEYKIKDYYIVKYYRDKIWMQYEWVITNFIPIWFFVQLDNLVEWFVEKSNIFDFNEEFWTIKNKKTNEIYKLWTKIKIELAWIEEDRLRLVFKVL